VSPYESQWSFARFLHQALSSYGLKGSNYVIFGSAVMKLHGLKDKIGDIDVFTTPRMYAYLRDRSTFDETYPTKGDPPLLTTRATYRISSMSHATPSGPVTYEVNVFHAWTSRDRWIDVPECWARAERIMSLNCIPLDIVAQQKREAMAIVESWGIPLEGTVWHKHRDDLRICEQAIFQGTV
jgi:hypothetical protein